MILEMAKENRVITILASICLLSVLTFDVGSADNELSGQELSRFLNQLREGDTEARLDAAIALAQMGQFANQAFSSLILALSRVRRDSADALAKIGVPSDPNQRLEIVSPLIRALGDDNPQVRANIANVLSGIGEPAKQAVPTLIQTLHDSDVQVRASTADALGKIGKPLKQVLSALIYALNDNQALVRANAADALGGIGPPAKQSVPALINAVNDEDKWVRLNVVMALGLIKEPTDTVVTCLASTLDDVDQRVRSFLAIGLGSVGQVSAKQLKRRSPI